MAFLHFVFKGTSGIGRGANWFTWWLQDTGVGEPSDADGLADLLLARLDTHMIPFLNSNYSLGRVDYTFYDGLNTAPYPTQVYNPTPMSGEDTSAPLPSRITLLSEFKAFANSGPVRKRIYVGCYGEDYNTTASQPDSDLIVAYHSFSTAMLGGVSTAGHDWNPVICRLDPLTGGIVAWNAINSYLVQTKWAFLRSRDSGIGI